MKPSPEADKATLLRRVTLDLTGLPPTPAEVDAFLADNSPDAYEKVVDRLLASPRYGERMATDWLDAARYADTNGYQTDGVRHMWRWRDWVIDALNRNMPFDQFTIEQLAGDLLAGATLDQKIATGFNRNHRGNAEGGIIPEEYAVEYVVDRVDTTATVWLGLTLGCARCHDHKFDPFTQKEFYQLFAFFNNVPERGRAVEIGNSDPQIKAPTPAQQAELRRLDEQLAAARNAVRQLAAADRRGAGRVGRDRLRPAAAGRLVASRRLVAPFAARREYGRPLRYARQRLQRNHGNADVSRRPDRRSRRVFRQASRRRRRRGELRLLRPVLDQLLDQAAESRRRRARPHGRSGRRGRLQRRNSIDGKLQLNLIKRWLDESHARRNRRAACRQTAGSTSP